MNCHIPVFALNPSLAKRHEQMISDVILSHSKGEGRKAKLPKSGHKGGATPLAPHETVDFRVLTICLTGEHTPNGTKPDDVSTSKWSSTFCTLYRKKLLDRRPAKRAGAKYQYMITKKGLATQSDWAAGSS